MPDISKRLERAEKYLQKGKTDSALEEYLHILEEDPGNDAIRQAAADVCVILNRPAEAASLLGTIFEHQAGIGDAAKANITYKKLSRIATPSADQTFRYGQFLEKSSKKDALDAYRTAVQGFIAGGKKPEAVAAMKRLVSLEPTLENFRKQGELAAQAGDNKSAALAFLEIGELETKAGSDAFSSYERSYTLNPGNPQAALAYGRALVAKGDAKKAIAILAPLAKAAGSSAESRHAYARALLAGQRTQEAEPYIWEFFEKNPADMSGVGALLAAQIDSEQSEKALEVAKKLEEHERKAGRRREFVAMLKEITDKHHPDVDLLEYIVDLYNMSNREQDYSQALLRLFDLYYAAGKFLKAADALDRAVEVDGNDPGHQKRLEMVRGKIDNHRFSAIANRFSSAAKGGLEGSSEPATKGESTVLEDLLLQAEIFLQYGMRSKAVERLERINKLFPREEEKNEKLRLLYNNAGFLPKYEGATTPASTTATMPAAAGPLASASSAYSGAAVGAPPAMSDENAVDNISRVTEITRKLYRQANIKSVLFTAVNEIGRYWNASRCVAGLCAPGKSPSAALEYCAPGVEQSEVNAIVKLIATLQGLALAQGVVSIAHAQGAPELEPVKHFVSALAIDSLLAVPLCDGEEHLGIIILEQSGSQRTWRQTDVVVLKTIADQMVLAVHNARLRSLMKNLAVTDEKSGLLKRSSYLDVLLSEVRRALQQNSPLSVMLMHFGKASALVKELGENGVESLMQQLGQQVSHQIRQNDVAVRYELTTIALILPDTNDKNAFFVVDKLRKAISTTTAPGKDLPTPMTVGIGEAVMQSRFDPVDIVTEVINRVDSALEAARNEGGNKARSLPPALEAAAVA